MLNRPAGLDFVAAQVSKPTPSDQLQAIYKQNLTFISYCRAVVVWTLLHVCFKLMAKQVFRGQRNTANNFLWSIVY